MLSTLAASDRELLLWHLSRQPSRALSLCMGVLAEYSGAAVVVACFWLHEDRVASRFDHHALKLTGIYMYLI